MNINEIVDIATVIRAAHRGARVARLFPDGTVIYGTARRITGPSEDVSQCALDVTTDQGWETQWDILTLANEIYPGEFVVDPDE